MFNFVLALHIIVAIAMTGLILIQHGKGADAGASFGSGASGTVFGAAGSATFLTRATAVLTAIFFTTSLILAVQASNQARDLTQLDESSLNEASLSEPAVESTVSDVSDITDTEASLSDSTPAQ